jgi:hypothetical protein
MKYLSKNNMRELNEEQMKSARDEKAAEYYNSPCLERVHYQVGFMDCFKWMQENLINQPPQEDESKAGKS